MERKDSLFAYILNMLRIISTRKGVVGN